MKSDSYLITCLNCKGQSRLGIVNNQHIIYKDHTPIIASRLRPDMRWGFECICGQDSRVALEEQDQIEILVQGGAHAIDAIRKSLKIKDNDKFSMEKR